MIKVMYAFVFLITLSNILTSGITQEDTTMDPTLQPPGEPRIGVDPVKYVKTLSYTYNLKENGSYKFSYLLSDGTTREEEGRFVGENYVVEGFYVYFDQELEKHAVEYIADKDGYRATIVPQVLPDENPALGPELPAGLVASLIG